MQGLFPNNFLGLDRKSSNFESAAAVVLPIGYEGTVSYGTGTRNGPKAIIAASAQVETYDREFDSEPCSVGIATLEELQHRPSGPEEMMRAIEAIADDVLDLDKFLMSLGGEHSITYPLVKSHMKKFPDISVLQVDAHSDLREEYQGSIYSHASVMSRVRELCPFVSVGIRSFCDSDNERETVKKGRIFDPDEFHNNANAVSNILSKLSSDVYITFDLDGLDPSIMPAVGTPEPGGLSWSDAIGLIRAVGREKKIVGADVVELAPIPGLVYPEFTAAKLVYKIISIAMRGRIK